MNRREFLTSTAAAAAAGLPGAPILAPSAGPLDVSSVRADFPIAETKTYLNSAGQHPISLSTARVGESYLQFESRGPGPGRLPFGGHDFEELRGLFARLIHARPSEIVFIQSTLMGENMVAAGLGLHRSGGNVVTDELHYHGGLHIYRSLQKAGLEVRIVKQRDWRIEPADVERMVDRNTRLVSLTLVSNINGFLHDSARISEIAHAHGAYVYADVVQAAGCVPVDVRAMGIDFCAASTYKWLMGLRGFGFLYVREELQEKVQPTQFGDQQYTDFEYHIFPGSPPGADNYSMEAVTGAARYQVGNVSNIAAACQRHALNFILETGVENILAHSKPLADRVLEEVPRLGYPAITPPDTPAPIVAFLVEDPPALQSRLKKANVDVKVKWNQMRVSPSVFNTQQDVDRLLNALS